ncbi:MAG TPA: FkbM family methyltransferase [Myxococcota bacterium]|nr:FkbM family methyltransferase [Myxococcota bacterium]
MNDQLIIDVGMHTGRDTEFYLKKGFHVVGIEANPALVREVERRLHDYIRQRRLTIYNVAIHDREGEVDFHVNLQKDDWGTTSESFAARNRRLGTQDRVIRVPCLRFETILEQCGVPYYLKIDIEGADLLCLSALHQVRERPRYVSIEAGLTSFDETFTELSHFWTLGYRRFKIVNQALNPTVRCPRPPLEGDYVDAAFDGTTSGPFGEEAPGAWLDVEQTLARYRSVLREQALFGAQGRFYGTRLARLHAWYRRIAGKEPVGWYDIHARLGDAA